jgi:hypothetical protein
MSALTRRGAPQRTSRRAIGPIRSFDTACSPLSALDAGLEALPATGHGGWLDAGTLRNKTKALPRHKGRVLGGKMMAMLEASSHHP